MKLIVSRRVFFTGPWEAPGAIGGAIGGDAGKGAEIGAAVGATAGLFRHRRQMREQQQYNQAVSKEQNARLNEFDQAYSTYEGKGYTVGGSAEQARSIHKGNRLTLRDDSSS